MEPGSAIERSAVEVHVTGRVQGVGFRWHCAEVAARLGVNGWVRNLADGRVQAWFEGAADDVEAMVRWATAGPTGAKVQQIDAQTRQPEGFDAFQIRR